MVDLLHSGHLFDLALKSAMAVVKKELLLKGHPDSFPSLSESHPEID